MIRIGIFSVLYTVPATLVIGCYLYEASFFDDWSNGLTCPCLAMERHREKPLYSILMLKYFMALAVGITSGVWIWSGKTLDSWRRFWRCLGMPAVPNGMAQGSANHTLLQKRPPIPQPYLGTGVVCGGGGGGQTSATASLLTTPYTHGGSVASTSHHHLHHHVLKQTPMSHV